MNKTNFSNIDIILPPGEKLPKRNINREIVKIGDLVINSSDYLYPTFVLAEQIKDDNNVTLTVTTGLVVKANEDQVNSYLRVNQLFTIGDYGQYKLQFFIYNAPKSLTETPHEHQEGAIKYNIFKLSFSTDSTATLPKGITLEDIDVVETFLWQIDPKTSRGTVTTVQTQN